MNISCCPNCGGPVTSESIGWKCRGECKGFIGMDGVFHKRKEEPFLPIMTNGDQIRAMSDEELADFLDKCEGMGYSDSSVAKDKNGNCVDMLDWLRQPAEEGTV